MMIRFAQQLAEFQKTMSGKNHSMWVSWTESSNDWHFSCQRLKTLNLLCAQWPWNMGLEYIICIFLCYQMVEQIQLMESLLTFQYFSNGKCHVSKKMHTSITFVFIAGKFYDQRKRCLSKRRKIIILVGYYQINMEDATVCKVEFYDKFEHYHPQQNHNIEVRR